MVDHLKKRENALYPLSPPPSLLPSLSTAKQQDEIRGAMIHVLSEGQFGMPSVDGESFYSSPSSTSGASSGRSEGGGDARGGGGDTSGGGGSGSGSGSADGDSGSGLKLIRLEEVSKSNATRGNQDIMSPLNCLNFALPATIYCSGVQQQDIPGLCRDRRETHP